MKKLFGYKVRDRVVVISYKQAREWEKRLCGKQLVRRCIHGISKSTYEKYIGRIFTIEKDVCVTIAFQVVKLKEDELSFNWPVHSLTPMKDNKE